MPRGSNVISPQGTMEDMAIYAEQNNVSGILEELMQSLLVAQPSNPLEFLIDELNNGPELSVTKGPQTDTRRLKTRKNFLDLRRMKTKLSLLQELFDECLEVNAIKSSSLTRGELITALRRKSVLIHRHFKNHRNEIPTFIEAADLEKSTPITFEMFRDIALEALKVSGGR